MVLLLAQTDRAPQRSRGIEPADVEPIADDDPCAQKAHAGDYLGCDA